jgi:tetratricopeptide (TPR) repeat protein
VFSPAHPEPRSTDYGTEVAEVMILDAQKEKGLNEPQVHGMSKRSTSVLIAAALAVVLTAAPSCSPAPDQIRFGVWASQNNLWDEAIFRWRKALQADPGSAAAHNNLGVAYEKKGLFDDALREYEAALKIEPGNTFVKSNYQNCKENIQAAAKEDEKKKAPNEKK